MKSVQQFIKQSFFIFSVGLILISTISIFVYWNNVYEANLKLIDEVNLRVRLSTAAAVRNARNNLLVAEVLMRDQILKKSFDFNFVEKMLAAAINYNQNQSDIFLALSEKYSKTLKHHPDGYHLLVTRVNQKFLPGIEEIQETKSSFDINKFKLSLYTNDDYYKNPNEIWYKHSVENAGRFSYTGYYFDKKRTKQWVISLARSIYDDSKNLIGVVGIDYLIINIAKGFAPLAGNLGLIVFQSYDGQIVINVPSKNFNLLPSKPPSRENISNYIKNFKFLISEAETKKLHHHKINKTLIVYKVYQMPVIPWHFVVYQNATEFYWAIIPFVATSLSASLILIGGFLYFLQKNKNEFLPPVKNLLNAIKRDVDFVSHNQNISAKYKESNVLEVNEVTKYINKLLEAINENFQKYKSELEKNIESKEKIIKIEKEARNEAEKSVRLRDDFLSIASHELKTPLTPIRLQIGLVKRNIKEICSDHPKSTIILKALEDADKNFNGFLKLVEDLLDVSRITADRFIIEKEKLNLSELVQQNIENFSSEFSQRNYEVIVNIESDIYGLWDKTRMNQVLNNLLSNAIKYGEGKTIEITLTKEKNENTENIAKLVVRDHGIGIAESNIPKLFGRFERIAPVSQYGGLGLGLYITKCIVAAHEGIIKVESDLQKGSTFIVELPIKL